MPLERRLQHLQDERQRIVYALNYNLGDSDEQTEAQKRAKRADYLRLLEDIDKEIEALQAVLHPEQSADQDQVATAVRLVLGDRYTDGMHAELRILRKKVDVLLYIVVASISLNVITLSALVYYAILR